MKETPDRVYGRLLESVHISGYTFERAFSELEWLLEEDRWKTVGGYNDINSFLATIDLSEFKIGIEQRKKLAKRLKDIEASQRMTARLIGVTHTTVQRDLGTNVPPAGKISNEPEHRESSSGTNVPPAMFQQSGKEHAELARKQVKKEQRKVDILREREEYSARSEGGDIIADLETLIAAGKQFPVIYADPPWEFQVWGGKDQVTAAERHYNTMPLDAIKALRVSEVAEKDCALFLWCVMPELPGALDVIQAWGFEYKTVGFTWVKQNRSGDGIYMGMGYWTRANAEICIIGARGSPTRHAKDVSQIILSPVQEHSKKPAEARSRIQQLLIGPYLEMFGRKVVPGWTVVGNEVRLEAAE